MPQHRLDYISTKLFFYGIVSIKLNAFDRKKNKNSGFWKKKNRKQRKPSYNYRVYNSNYARVSHWTISFCLFFFIFFNHFHNIKDAPKIYVSFVSLFFLKVVENRFFFNHSFLLWNKCVSNCKRQHREE